MKKFVKLAFVAAFAAIAGYGVYTSQKSVSVSDLMLANVEALADSELSNSNCTASWYKECCVCGTSHYTYAYPNGSACEHRVGCSHF